MPGAASPKLTPAGLRAIPGDRHHYCSHFTDGKTEAPSGWATGPRSHSRTVNPGTVLLTTTDTASVQVGAGQQGATGMERLRAPPRISCDRQGATKPTSCTFSHLRLGAVTHKHFFQVNAIDAGNPECPINVKHSYCHYCH